jgi:hypothetical protein
MRVFRPTSPMNVGRWILGASLASSAVATYPRVLVGNTAVPVWHATRNRLPPWFAATSASSLAALVELAWPAVGLAAYGVAKAAQLVTARGRAHGDRGGSRPAVPRGPLRRDLARAWWLNAASLIASLVEQRRLAGAPGTAAGLASRFAILEIGRASAADPRATFEPQRTRNRVTL